MTLSMDALPIHKVQWKTAVLIGGQTLPIISPICAFLGQQTFIVITGDGIQDDKQPMDMHMLLSLQLNFPRCDKVERLSSYGTCSLQGDGISHSGTLCWLH